MQCTKASRQPGDSSARQQWDRFNHGNSESAKAYQCHHQRSSPRRPVNRSRGSAGSEDVYATQGYGDASAIYLTGPRRHHHRRLLPADRSREQAVVSIKRPQRSHRKARAMAITPTSGYGSLKR